MTILLIGLHVVICLFLIFVVLLQSAQAADLAGAFGGGGSQTALGMRGATTMLHKATTVAALLFMVTSLALGLTGRGESSMIEGLQEPATPATAPSEAAGQQEQAPGAADQDQVQGAEEQQQDGSQGAADDGGDAGTGSDGSDQGGGAH